MGIFDNIKRMAQPYDDEYDDYEDEAAEYDREPRRVSRAAEEAPAVEYSGTASTASTVTGFSGQIVSGGRGKQEVFMFSPSETFGAEVYDTAKMLCAGKIVYMNATTVSDFIAGRLVDFLTGATFAINGTVKKCADKCYLFCPHNVEISGELKLDAEA